MGIFNRKPIEEQNQASLNEQEEPEPEEEETICINCKHHQTEGEYDHNCYANATEETNYITGDKKWVDVEDCEDTNDGNCPDYEKKP